jgi:iron complex outermembrane recepter protein
LNVEAALANGWTLASTSAWDRFEALRIEDDAVQLYAPILYFHDAQEGSALQQELRLLSPDNARVTWLAGVFVLRSDFERGAHGSVPVFGPNGALAFDSIWPTPFALPDQHGVHDSRTIATYWSAFAEATLPITARLELNIGARWHDEHKRARIENSVAVPGASIVASVLTPSVGAMNAPINGQVERRSEAFTWSITPKYHVSEHLMTYATAARNTKAGGFNNGTGSAPLSPREFGDETIHHFELGFRQVVSQRQLTVSGAAFRTRYENYQDATFLLAQFAVGNVERVDLTGAELSGKTQLGERTTLDAAVSYVDLEYVRHTAGMCYPGRPPDGRLAGSCDLSGERPLAAPPWQTQLGLQHTVPTSWGTVFGRVDWSWSDRYFTTFSLDPRLVQQNAHEVGLRLGTRIDDAYEIILWGRNLLGEDIVEIASTLNFFNDTSWQSFMGEPRSYGVTLRARF